MPVPTITQQFEAVDVDTLSLHPENANRGNTAAIADSIEENGFYGACVVQVSTRRVLVGNHRLLAARRLRQATVPVLWLDCDDERALKILLADNGTRRGATTNAELLAEVFKKLRDPTKGTGYTAPDVVQIMAAVRPKVEYLERISAMTRGPSGVPEAATTAMGPTQQEAPSDNDATGTGVAGGPDGAVAAPGAPDGEPVALEGEWASAPQSLGHHSVHGTGIAIVREEAFPLAIVLTREEAQTWAEVKKSLGVSGDKAAFVRLLDAYGELLEIHDTAKKADRNAVEQLRAEAAQKRAERQAEAAKRRAERQAESPEEKAARQAQKEADERAKEQRKSERIAARMAKEAEEAVSPWDPDAE